MTIKGRILLICGLIAGLTISQTLVSGYLDQVRDKSDAQGQLLFTQMRNQMVADMNHDALRATVYSALYSAHINDQPKVETAIAEEAEYADDLRKAMAENLRDASDPELLAKLNAANADMEAYVALAEKLVKTARGNSQEANALLPEYMALFKKLEVSMEKIEDYLDSSLAQKQAASESSNFLILAVFAVLSFVLVGWAVVSLRRTVVQPMTAVTATLERMAGGDYDVSIATSGRGDEIDQMLQAAHVFRETALAKQAAEREQQHVVTELASGLRALADGDVSHRIETAFAREYETLRENFNRAVDELSALLEKVSTAANSVSVSANEIRAASDDLGMRTEQQAASLEETAAAMNQVTGLVQDTADSATEMQRSIAVTHREATDGGKIVHEAIEAMAGIEKSSDDIATIINVIDGISFQTNLLALNAGVEAARAGDAGKGFAVVASEVRALAQRSAEAAQEIKQLITTSGARVSDGVALVNETGGLLEKIIARIGELNTQITAIAGTAEQQATNLQQVNSTVGNMDRTTQQNAAMVEQSNAAARHLADESSSLTSLLASFRFGSAGGAPAVHAPRPVQPARAQARPAVSGNLALKVSEPEDDWTEF